MACNKDWIWKYIQMENQNPQLLIYFTQRLDTILGLFYKSNFLRKVGYLASKTCRHLCKEFEPPNGPPNIT